MYIVLIYKHLKLRKKKNKKEEKNIYLHYCPINFYHSIIILISHFVRNDNQLFIFREGVKKQLRCFLTPSLIKNI